MLDIGGRGHSGRTFERKGSQRMMADVEAGKIDCIVVKDLSRLGRSAIDTGYYIEKYFPLHHVRFIAVNDQYDSEDNDYSGSHLTVPLKNIINEAYAADTAKKVKSQLHQSMTDGEYIGARPPYGYRKAPDNCHKLLVNEETAPVVRDIFEWTANGMPLNVVVKQLNEAGIMTPGYYHASCGLFSFDNKLAGNGKWQTWTVNKILSDEVYVGDMVQGKTKIVGHKQVPAPPEEWIIVRNTHEQIISRELFEQARSVREQAAAKSRQSDKVPYSENILRGRIFCGCCGKNLHRQRCHDHYVYRCITNDRAGKGTCRDGVRCFRETDLFDIILTTVHKEAENIIGNRLKLNEKDCKLTAQKASVDSDISELQKQTRASRKYLTGLYESLVNGVLTTEEYRSLKSRYENEVKDGFERICQLQEQQRELKQQLEEYICLADRLTALDRDTALSALLVNQLIDRVTVYGPDKVSIDFHFESGFERVYEVLADD